MEPISMAIGIVPLSMQLVKTIITIKELVNDHRSAAKELDHICRKLDKLEDVCKLLNIALSEASGSSFTIGQSVMFDNLQCTIKECCVEVSHVYQEITKISRNLSKTRSPFRSTGYILLNYRLPRVLMISNRGSDFGISVRKAFESDNIQAIVGFFSQGLLTTATIVTYTEYNPEDEASLLGLAISFKSRKVLNFLKDHMDFSEERNHVALLDFPCRWPKTDEGFSCILDYIHMRKMQMTLEEFRRFFHCHEARHMIAYVEACRQYFLDDLEGFNDVVLRQVSYMFGLVSIYQTSSSPIENWASLLANAVPRGRDLITSSECHFKSTLWFIQQYSFNSDAAWQSLCRWIDILELAQVDVSNCLRVAIKRSFKNWADTQICDEGIVRRIPR
ncbi:uncharacterized protein FTJAE_5914 [Fusarium tjaetaba]|uniref:Fungal N-terminal domain-containing protein n=1 Tax=Fusarium tjaetaba TaxID=1567544 RepID=A0A8H5RNS9_9HYPO|nr:uncharacterized protein FTJAE_5914 [Fusarium tjaetaba]KAF5636718.1 hypothetical protein FTJAE_5914 [Fusarium tjaetaba]